MSIASTTSLVATLFTRIVVLNATASSQRASSHAARRPFMANQKSHAALEAQVRKIVANLAWSAALCGEVPDED